MKKISLLGLICFGAASFVCESDAAQVRQWPQVNGKNVVIRNFAYPEGLSQKAREENFKMQIAAGRGGKAAARKLHPINTAEDAQQYVEQMNAYFQEAAEPNGDQQPRNPGQPNGDRAGGQDNQNPPAPVQPSAADHWRAGALEQLNTTTNVGKANIKGLIQLIRAEEVADDLDLRGMLGQRTDKADLGERTTSAENLNYLLFNGTAENDAQVATWLLELQRARDEKSMELVEKLQDIILANTDAPQADN